MEATKVEEKTNKVYLHFWANEITNKCAKKMRDIHKKRSEKC